MQCSYWRPLSFPCQFLTKVRARKQKAYARVQEERTTNARGVFSRLADLPYDAACLLHLTNFHLFDFCKTATHNPAFLRKTILLAIRRPLLPRDIGASSLSFNSRACVDRRGEGKLPCMIHEQRKVLSYHVLTFIRTQHEACTCITRRCLQDDLLRK
ncbi:hypothetical protein PMI08_01983 [Brevibacillus sp. CF112]|nr:hypothetical protein PMI08_01983 [Brevibacillus sp. CF112]